MKSGKSMTIIDMLERCVELFSDKIALIYKEEKISHEMLFKKTNALANFLVGLGLKKNEKVGLLMNKTPEAIISFLGAATAGGIVFPVDNNQTLDHIQYLLDLTRPDVLIVSAGFQQMLSCLNISCPDQRIIITGQNAEKRYHSWHNVVNGNNRDRPKVDININDVVYFNLTSGSTGVPKCAITTHDNIFQNTLSSVKTLGLTHEDVHLCMFPVFSHPHELFARPLYLGGTIVLTDKISPRSITAVVADNGVTCMMAIASIYETLFRFHESTSFNFTSLRLPESGGMHLAPTLAKKFKDRFKLPIVPVWGSTETSGIALAASVNSEYRPGSFGKPCSGYEIIIVDKNGEKLPADEVGEMIIRGPAVCSGYLGNREETEKNIKNGWFYTGDMVKKDSEGYYSFMGRKTGMMKVAGLKVFPTEIENVLSMHPEIAEVAVAKAQNGLHGEVPRAVIVTKNNVVLDKKDIRKYCEQKMSRYKVPRIIEFRDSLPRTSGGKILLSEL